MKTAPDLCAETVRERLARHRPKVLVPEDRRPAAVAMILRRGEKGLEMLFIERARHEDDPWSGDLGFPGGKVEERDGGPEATAVRETCEEIGLDLTRCERLGRLDDITGAHLPIQVSCFVYLVRQPSAPPLLLNHEVARAFWFPLTALADRERHIETEVVFGGARLRRPALSLLPVGETVLWGITFRLVEQFLNLMQTGDSR